MFDLIYTPKAQIARLLGVDKLTLYRFLKNLESEE